MTAPNDPAVTYRHCPSTASSWTSRNPIWDDVLSSEVGRGPLEDLDLHLQHRFLRRSSTNSLPTIAASDVAEPSWLLRVVEHRGKFGTATVAR